MATERWNPWADLRRRDHIVFALDPVADHMGGAYYGQNDDGAAIVITPAFDRVQRKVALGHELVHDERGVLAHRSPATAREELRVNREVARRLIPLADLLDFVSRQAELEPITASVVAMEYDTTNAVAEEALRQLAERLLERELTRSASRRPSNP